MPGERGPRNVPMIPDAEIVARSGSVSNHWLTKSAEPIVSNWMKAVCCASGSAANRRANPASATNPRASSVPSRGAATAEKRLDEARHLGHQQRVLVVRLGVRPSTSGAARGA